MNQVMWSALCAAFATGDDYAEAVKKVTGYTNYSCKISVKSEGGAGKGGPGASFDCAYDSSAPAYVKGKGTEAYLQGGKLVYKGSDGKWAKLEPPQKGAKPEKGQREVMAMKNIRLPHEELSGFDSKVKDVKSEKDGETTVYSGSLTDEAAKEIGAVGRKGGQMTYSGSAKLWVDASGVLVKYELVIGTKGKIKEKEIDVTTTRTVELSGIGSTAKPEVPEDAKKRLE